MKSSVRCAVLSTGNALESSSLGKLNFKRALPENASSNRASIILGNFSYYNNIVALAGIHFYFYFCNPKYWILKYKKKEFISTTGFN